MINSECQIKNERWIVYAFYNFGVGSKIMPSYYFLFFADQAFKC